MSKIIVEEADLKSLIAKMDKLTAIVLSDKTNAQWLDEVQAAAMMGYKDVRRFRKLVKEATLPVEYCTTNGRSYQYSRKSITKYLNENSTLVSKTA